MLQCTMQPRPCWLATQMSESVEMIIGKQMTCTSHYGVSYYPPPFAMPSKFCGQWVSKYFADMLYV